MTPDWKGIRLDYSQGMTQSALQAKYGVAASTLRKRIRAEGWSRKESAKVQEDEQISVSVPRSPAPDPRLTRVDALADAMLGCLERAVRELDTVTQNVREKSKLEDGAELVTDFERLLPEEKGIKDVLTLRSDADTREQEARIAKLQRDLDRETEKASVTVVLEGESGCYAE